MSTEEPEKLYGLDGWETLEDSVEAVVERVFEGFDLAVGESDESCAATADRMEWPMKVNTFKRMTVGEEETNALARRALDNMLDDLGDEYGDPDGDDTEATESMKAAALAFAKTVVDGFVPWACNATGDVIEVTREQAMAMVQGDPND